MTKITQEEVDAIMAKVYAGGVVTREEAESIVRYHDRRCAGPIKPEYKEQYEALSRELVAAGPTGGYNIASIADMNAIMRSPCGYDVNNLVCKFPFDGTNHEVPCPNCGTILGFSTPRFPEEAPLPEFVK